MAVGQRPVRPAGTIFAVKQLAAAHGVKRGVEAGAAAIEDAGVLTLGRPASGWIGHATSSQRRLLIWKKPTMPEALPRI